MYRAMSASIAMSFACVMQVTFVHEEPYLVIAAGITVTTLQESASRIECAKEPLGISDAFPSLEDLSNDGARCKGQIYPVVSTGMLSGKLRVSEC